METNLLSVLVDRKLIRQGEYKEHRQEGEIFLPISFDSERNRRKKRTKKGKGQQNVASFPLLELPHPMAEYVGDYYLTSHFSFC